MKVTSFLLKKNRLLIGFAFLSFSLTSSANIFNDIKNEVQSFAKKRYGYGLAHGVLNATPILIIANGQTVPISATNSINDVKKVKQDGYVIWGGDVKTNTSSITVKEASSGKSICKVNVKLVTKYDIGDKRPTIKSITPTIEQKSNIFHCQILDSRKMTVKGQVAAAVTTMVIPLAALPPQSIPK